MRCSIATSTSMVAPWLAHGNPADHPVFLDYEIVHLLANADPLAGWEAIAGWKSTPSVTVRPRHAGKQNENDLHHTVLFASPISTVYVSCTHHSSFAPADSKGRAHACVCTLVTFSARGPRLLSALTCYETRAGRSKHVHGCSNDLLRRTKIYYRG